VNITRKLKRGGITERVTVKTRAAHLKARDCLFPEGALFCESNPWKKKDLKKRDSDDPGGRPRVYDTHEEKKGRALPEILKARGVMWAKGPKRFISFFDISNVLSDGS